MHSNVLRISSIPGSLPDEERTEFQPKINKTIGHWNAE